MKSTPNQIAFQNPGSAKTPQGWQAKGAFNTAFDNANITPIGDILDKHYCTCRDQVLCVFCLGWSRTIRSIEARRADSLRGQSLGDLMRAGG